MDDQYIIAVNKHRCKKRRTPKKQNVVRSPVSKSSPTMQRTATTRMRYTAILLRFCNKSSNNTNTSAASQRKNTTIPITSSRAEVNPSCIFHCRDSSPPTKKKERKGKTNSTAYRRQQRNSKEEEQIVEIESSKRSEKYRYYSRNLKESKCTNTGRNAKRTHCGV
jgi:hypothetical protein